MSQYCCHFRESGQCRETGNGFRMGQDKKSLEGLVAFLPTYQQWWRLFWGLSEAGSEACHCRLRGYQLLHLWQWAEEWQSNSNDCDAGIMQADFRSCQCNVRLWLRLKDGIVCWSAKKINKLDLGSERRINKGTAKTIYCRWMCINSACYTGLFE